MLAYACTSRIQEFRDIPDGICVHVGFHLGYPSPPLFFADQYLLYDGCSTIPTPHAPFLFVLFSQNGDVVAILTAPFLPAKPPTAAAAAVAAAEVETAPTTESERPTVDVPLHVHTGVWPLNMGAMPMTQRSGEEPELLMEIDEIPFMTKGEKRLAREVELQHARLRCEGEVGAGDVTPGSRGSIGI